MSSSCAATARLLPDAEPIRRLRPGEHQIRHYAADFGGELEPVAGKAGGHRDVAHPVDHEVAGLGEVVGARGGFGATGVHPGHPSPHVVLQLARRDRVEDLAQETFLSVFRSLGQFAPLGPARLSSWILTIASRRAIDELRRAGEAPVELDGEALVSPVRADERARRRDVLRYIAICHTEKECR